MDLFEQGRIQRIILGEHGEFQLLDAAEFALKINALLPSADGLREFVAKAIHVTYFVWSRAEDAFGTAEDLQESPNSHRPDFRQQIQREVSFGPRHEWWALFAHFSDGLLDVTFVDVLADKGLTEGLQEDEADAALFEFFVHLETTQNFFITDGFGDGERK